MHHSANHAVGNLEEIVVFSAYRKRIKPRFLRTQTRSLLEMMNMGGTAHGTLNVEVDYMQKLLI